MIGTVEKKRSRMHLLALHGDYHKILVEINILMHGINKKSRPQVARFIPNKQLRDLFPHPTIDGISGQKCKSKAPRTDLHGPYGV